VKRRAVRAVMDRHGLSERRACELADLHRSVFQYQKQDRGDEALRRRLRELANERRRFGYRRLGILLAREGFEVNHKKLFRLYREEGLAVRRRRSRKRALGTRRPILVPDRANQRWSLDFVSDALTDGRRFRVLCIVDDFSREALATVADRSLSGLRLTRELDDLIRQRGRPDMIVSDNGTETRKLQRGDRPKVDGRFWPSPLAAGSGTVMVATNPAGTLASGTDWGDGHA